METHLHIKNTSMKSRLKEKKIRKQLQNSLTDEKVFWQNHICYALCSTPTPGKGRESVSQPQDSTETSVSVGQGLYHLRL